MDTVVLATKGTTTCTRAWSVHVYYTMLLHQDLELDKNLLFVTLTHTTHKKAYTK